eukprot:3748166-Lingulodinium_polyedra.AAC.1
MPSMPSPSSMSSMSNVSSVARVSSEASASLRQSVNGVHQLSVSTHWRRRLDPWQPIPRGGVRKPNHRMLAWAQR